MSLNNIILEDGYNSDYIYSIITALFYTQTDGTNNIINSDKLTTDAYYVQEFIKSKFIYQIHRSLTIESSTVNKLRLFLYNCGWLKDTNNHILEKSDLDKFYSFLVSKIFEYNLVVSRIDNNDESLTANNTVFDQIRITEDLLDDADKAGNVVNLSVLINRWTKKTILDKSLSYKFDVIPHILPVYIDIRDQDTKLNKRYLNIMEGVNFPDIGDKIQSMLIWEVHSLICQTEKGDYYTIVIDNCSNNNFMAFSDKCIPSNWLMNPSNVSDVKKIMREVRFVFYKLQ